MTSAVSTGRDRPAAARTLPGLLAAPAADLATARATWGPLPDLSGRHAVAAVAAELRNSGLTGRGGAAFPLWDKLSTALAAGGAAVVVANGHEGEPASAKDRTLLVRSPHLVLDGLEVLAALAGTWRRAVSVRPGPAADALAAAVAERRAARPVDGERRGDVEVRCAPDSGFVGGEASAVLAGLAGNRQLPGDHVVPLAVSGLRGRPTLVSNVETLAHLALIARAGAQWFRSCGTAAEPGSMLVTVGGAVAEPGVDEVALGTPLVEVVGRAGGPTAGVQALLVGGYHGTWVPGGDAVGRRLSRASLAGVGAVPGAGVLLVLPDQACGLAEAARITRWLADASAGQCGPCLNGLPRLADAVDGLAVVRSGAALRLGRGVDRRDTPAPSVAAVSGLAGLVDGRGACHHPDGTAAMVRSAVSCFADEVRAHAAGRCRAWTSPRSGGRS